MPYSTEDTTLLHYYSKQTNKLADKSDVQSTTSTDSCEFIGCTQL